MNAMNQDPWQEFLLTLKRIAQEKGYTVEVKENVIALVPRNTVQIRIPHP